MNQNSRAKDIVFRQAHEARGTAAIKRLEAGAEIREIAAHMDWSNKHAMDVIENHAALHPSMTDALGRKLADLDDARNQTKK